MRTELMLIVGVVCLICLAAEAGMAASEAPQFRGLSIGVATREDAVKLLGQPKYGDPAKDEKLVYDSTRAGQVDELTFEGEPKRLSVVEAATPPEGLATRAGIVAKLGAPEYELRLGRQTMLEYSQRGMRLWVDNKTGTTIGAALFPPREYPRAPVGEQRRVVVPPIARPSKGKPARFNVGFASRLILPPPGMAADPRYTKVHDDLEVRCIVISSGGKTVAITAGDIFVFTSYEIGPIQQGARAAGIDYLLFASTHSHSAPDGVGLDIPHADEYDAFVQQQAIACIQEAKQNLAPATIEVSQAEIMLDGAHIALIARNWRDPGIVWPYVTAVRFMAADGKKQPLGTLVQFTCHPERLARYDNAISSDWVGPMRRTVEAALGGMCVFVNGPLGGMVSPDEVPGSEPFADTQRIGEWIGNQAIAAARAGASPITDGELRIRLRPLLIPLVNEKILALREKGWMKGALIHGSHATEVGGLDIGELCILAVPGELLPDLGFRALALVQQGSHHNLIVGLANDEIGYIIPAWDYHVGQYEEMTGLGPSSGPQVMDAADEIARGRVAGFMAKARMGGGRARPGR
jgi:hypothetical protein